MARKTTVGDVYAVLLQDGRYGACRIVEKSGLELLLVVCDWIGNEPPHLSDPVLRTIMRRNSFEWGGQLFVRWIIGSPPPEFRYLGHLEPLPQEKRVPCHAGTHWDAIPRAILQETEWEHDRDAAISKVEQTTLLVQRRLVEQESKRRAELTFETLRGERLFSAWEADLPKKLVAICRQVFRDTIDRLVASGRSAPEAAVLGVLRECIERFNALHEEHEQFIETIEREDICRHFDELVHLSGLKGYNDLADQWRTW